MTTAPDLETLCNSGERAVRKRDLSQARELFRQALEIDEASVKAHQGLATIAFMQRDYETAASHFQRVTELDPRDASALINLGAVYNRMHDYDGAVSTLRRGLGKDARSSQGYYNLGIAHKNLGQNSMAVSAYREALRLNPDMAEAHQNLGNVYLEMGSHQQAALCFRKALELKPDFGKAKVGLERVRKAAEQAKNAISPFGRLVDQEHYAPKAAQSVTRELTIEERADDRAHLSEIIDGAIVSATRLLEHLKATLEPSLLSLNRAVAQAKKGDVSMRHEAFQHAVRECTDLRQQLRRRLLELRAHEELMSSPDLASEESEESRT